MSGSCRIQPGVDGPTRRNRASDKAVMVLSFIGVSAPQFVVGLLLLYVFAHKLALFPLGGYGTLWHVVQATPRDSCWLPSHNACSPRLWHVVQVALA